MKIGEIIQVMEELAPPELQENYDNAGLIIGNADWECTGILCTLDSTENVIDEAQENNCNLIVAHHPIVFSGLKKINGKNYVEKAVIAAIKSNIAIYAVHTNLDNVRQGVNDKIADKLELVNRKVLLPKADQLMKLFVFVPIHYADKLRNAIFEAGAGAIGNYSECSFNSSGKGTFKGGENTNAFVGEKGKRHEEEEIKIEVIFPSYLQKKILPAMIKAHPYEEVAYDLILLENNFKNVGSGLIGELKEEMKEIELLSLIKKTFGLSVIKHTKLSDKKIKKIALCGGAGSFLIGKALTQKADFYLTSDIKYHEFFDANDKLVIADIGHWESEQFTIDLFYDILVSKFTNFAVLKTKMKTNPVEYFL